MTISRRHFLSSAGLAVVAGAVLTEPKLAVAGPQASTDEWRAFRGLFELSTDYIQMSTFYFSSHPRPVREAIEKYRKQIDANPFLVVDGSMFENQNETPSARVARAAAEYLGGKSEEIALTNSTTMGLALIYSGLPLKAGQEILTTEHDHYSHHEAIRFATSKVGASMRKIALYSDDSVSEESIVERIRVAVRPETRVVGVTWVHSSTGVKLPLRSIADAIQKLNMNRDEEHRVLLVVDGVHGLGVEDETIAQTGIDFFAAGTHKWLFGPRGTGIVWASGKNWALMHPTIPSFYALELYEAWLKGETPRPPTTGAWVSPGGFHPYEHEWAVAEAFELHKTLGKKKVADRIHDLNHQCKEGLAAMKHVKLHTPRGQNLSAGIVCFDVDGMKPEAVVKALLEKKIVASTTPYATSYARLAPSLLNSPQEVDTTLAEIRALV